MMRKIIGTWLVLLVGGVLVNGAAAAGNHSLQIYNRLRFEWDDNIYQANTNKQDSFNIIEEVNLLGTLNFENTFLSMRVRPMFVYYSDREPDDNDFNLDFDFIFNHSFTPRLSMSLLWTVRRGELPELREDGAIIRDEDDYWYHTLNATLGFQVASATRLDLSGRYVPLRYDADNVASNEDYEIFSGGGTLRQQVGGKMTLLAECNFEKIEYKGPDRGSQSLYAGAGLEQIFTPRLLGSVRGGYQHKEFNDDNISSEDAPYVDGSLTVLPFKNLRLTGGVGYSMYEADVFPYTSQNRLKTYASLAYDITSRLSWYLTGSYTLGDYEAKQAILPSQRYASRIQDGEEETLQVSTRIAYQLTRSNWIEAGWQFVDFQTDYEFRVPYERNRLHLGWKFQF